MADDPKPVDKNSPSKISHEEIKSPKIEIKEVKEFKHEKIEKVEKVEFKEHKDAKVEKLEKIEAKEHKDAKIEKIEKNEGKEHKDTKVEKIEKNEGKEHKDSKIEKVESKEHLKIEQSEKPLGKEKDGKELVDGPGDNNPGEERQGLGHGEHFISSEQRPDLTSGALSRETDLKKEGDN